MIKNICENICEHISNHPMWVILYLNTIFVFDSIMIKIIYPNSFKYRSDRFFIIWSIFSVILIIRDIRIWKKEWIKINRRC